MGLDRRSFVMASSLAALGVSARARAGEPAAQTDPAAKNLTADSLEGIRGASRFGLRPGNSPQSNARALQDAIDWAHQRGGAIVIEPTDEPYPVAGGLRLRTNASLLGMHGPVGRGTRSPNRAGPAGSVFRIEDEEHPFLTVESATQLRGLQFWYARQTHADPERVIEYPPTVQVAPDTNVFGVTLSCLTFYGEFAAMDFKSPAPRVNEQILFEHCYGYPLSGRFIEIDRCYDIPRILHCHVNPATRRVFGRDNSRALNDSVIARGTFTYSIDHTDNAQLVDVFTFGAYGGIRLGAASYGQLTNFNLDCVTVGIHKSGDNEFNRNWQIAQGSIIANAGDDVQKVHPIMIDGVGHTALSNVEAFSGGNGAISNVASSRDFLHVGGRGPLTASLVGCRMRNYTADEPITMANPRATVVAVACIDKHQRPYSRP